MGQKTSLPLPTTVAVIENTRMRYDTLYRLMFERSGDELRRFVAVLRTMFAENYKKELDADDNIDVKTLFDETFERKVMRNDWLGRRYAMLVVFFAIVNHKSACNFFCPPPPDPDDPLAIDEAIVDRVAFTRFFKYVTYQLDNLMDATQTIDQFVTTMIATYWSLLPPDPLHRTGRADDKRPHEEIDVECSDDGGRTIKRRRTLRYLPPRSLLNNKTT